MFYHRGFTPLYLAQHTPNHRQKNSTAALSPLEALKHCKVYFRYESFVSANFSEVFL